MIDQKVMRWAHRAMVGKGPSQKNKDFGSQEDAEKMASLYEQKESQVQAFSQRAVVGYKRQSSLHST